MKKKCLSILLALALCLGMLAGCGGNESTDTGSTGGSTGDWDRDAKEHWQISDSGEKTDVGAHEVNGDNVCAVCGSHVWVLEDGTGEVYTYDGAGNLTRMTLYEADGTVNMESNSEYADGANGSYMVRSTDVYNDGSKYIMEYNEQGDNILWKEYDAEGNLIMDEAYEWTYTEEGNWHTQKIYAGGTLTQEIVFVTITEEDGWYTQPETITDYFEDGSRSVTTYDEAGETVSVITYDANGNEIAAG